MMKTQDEVDILSLRLNQIFGSLPKDVITKYSRDYLCDYAEACEHYWQLVIFFVACVDYPDRVMVPSKVVDEAWHNFILFTVLYTPWCQETFGRVIHHVPMVGSSDSNPDHNVNRRQTVVLLSEEYGADLRLWEGTSLQKISNVVRCKNGDSGRCDNNDCRGGRCDNHCQR